MLTRNVGGVIGLVKVAYVSLFCVSRTFSDATMKELGRQITFSGGEAMPIVHVNVWEGFGPKNAKTAIEGITKVFVDMGVPRHAVEIVVHEIPKTHWGVDGGPASEKLKDESPPK
jgi:4-oxalocrotonate tautomerase